MENEYESDATQPPDDIEEDNRMLTDEDCSQQSCTTSQTEMMLDDRFDPDFTSSVPLKRFYRKVRKEKYPFYAPEGIHCSAYTATIIYMLKRYRYQLIKAQKRSKSCCLPWGKPVLPGRHQSKTIDLKKRGCQSITFDTSEDEKEVSFKQTSDISANIKLTISTDKDIKSNPAKDSMYLGETQEYDPTDLLEDPDYVEMEWMPRVKPKPKSRLSNKRKSISPVPFQIESKNVSDPEDLKSSSSTPLPSQNREVNIHIIDDESRCSQGSNGFLNSQGDFYSTQIQQRRNTGNKSEKIQIKKNKPGRKLTKTKQETIKRKVDSDSDDDQLIQRHFRETTKKKRKLLPLDYSLLTDQDVFVSDDTDTNIKTKGSKTYLKKDRHPKSDSVGFDIDQILSQGTLTHSSQSQNGGSQSKHQTVDIDFIPSQSVHSEIISDLVSPIKNLGKKVKHTIFDSTNSSSSEKDCNKKPNHTSVTIQNERRSFRKVLNEEMINESNKEGFSSSNEDSSSQQPLFEKIESLRNERIKSKTVYVKPIVTQNKKTYFESSSDSDRLVIVDPAAGPSGSVDRIVNAVKPQRQVVHVHTADIHEEASNQIEMESNMIECPLCSNMFEISHIERHAATCGDDIQQVIQAPPRLEELEVEIPVRKTRSKATQNS
ncbi:uncharacterized protein LOC126815405 [Patella vulgata]|uniref:uncharacterized protein LOC126815405 n=1 Tax=Patella vulgata TaxID=6465 RepID=UPI00217F3316|nr:uncharacterized protein LOC126815405 [Patella vulgata]XP_050396978.1 uncharacterized protein LOC126815405 [Patella vulgata]